MSFSNKIADASVATARGASTAIIYTGATIAVVSEVLAKDMSKPMAKSVSKKTVVCGALLGAGALLGSLVG